MLNEYRGLQVCQDEVYEASSNLQAEPSLARLTIKHSITCRDVCQLAPVRVRHNLREGFLKAVNGQQRNASELL